MCNRTEHNAIVARNRSFYANISGSSKFSERYCEWESVILFYIAIHHCESLYADLGVHNEDHGRREEYLRDNIYRKNHNEDSRAMETAYCKMKATCNRSRYLGIIPTEKDIKKSNTNLETFIVLSNLLISKFVSETTKT